MSQIVRYLSHPQVTIDPNTPVTDWSLNEIGRERVVMLAGSGALSGTRQVVSSGEIKAIETATPLAKALGCDLVVREAMHENDRSATGFLPPEEFEIVADQFFARPQESVRGWETAVAAQTRIVREVRECLKHYVEGDVLLVGHGGVGTLLFCYLSDVPISRTFDQGAGGGGCYFEFTPQMEKPPTGWQTLEKLCTKGKDTIA
jgi:broad specificity phosphatase PhoE